MPMDRLRRIIFAIDMLLFFILMTLWLTGDAEVYSSAPADQVQRYTRAYEFDFVDWTVDAFGMKIVQASLGSPHYITPQVRARLVSEFLDLTYQVQYAQYRLNLIYADPAVVDPEVESAELRQELKVYQQRYAEISPFAEAVLQEQVSAVLADLGLTVGGQPLPPVLFHVSPLPYNLVISSRDRIQQDTAISLIPEITVAEQERLEANVDAGLNVSSLVVPVGGIGTYPTMVMQTTALDWLADTIAHEWIHNWLTLQPLGFNYAASPELRTMNETTAAIAGHEIARAVLEKYYPELIGRHGITVLSLAVKPPDPDDLPRVPFDFNKEMHATRVHVDELLAAGKIEQAEEYMEARRIFFWSKGCPQCSIRKLNQAFFAFYGAYADVPGGPAGLDPVGPAVRQLRAQSTSLADFLKRIAGMDSFQELLDAISP